MFDACICINTSDGETCDFHRIEYPTAKKRHRCTECWQWIAPGEHYEKTVGKWGGRFDIFKTCDICQVIRADLFECGFFYGMIWEFIHEMYCDDNEETGELECICPERIQ